MKKISLLFSVFICLSCLTGCNFKINIDFETDAIIEAILENNLEVLKSELEKGKAPNEYFKLKLDDSNILLVNPLEEACYLKNYEAVALLFQFGADVNIPFISGLSPLCMACLPPKMRQLYSDPPVLNQQTELIRFLLEQGADPNFEINDSGSIGYSNKVTPLLLVLSELNEQEKVNTNASILLQYGAQIIPFSCLYLSAGANYFDLSDKFIELGADLNAKSDLESKTCLMMFLENASSNNKHQKLYLNGASYLIDKGANFQEKDAILQKSPYEVAVEKGFSDLVQQMDLIMAEIC